MSLGRRERKLKNINTEVYWDDRFSSGDWEEKRGRKQTIDFAEEQTFRLGIPKSFAGTILDFGCGLGDAVTVYRRTFPEAKLIGLDHSKEGIERCRHRYGQYAEFIHGSVDDAPPADVIISSNVFEHLANDVQVAKDLAKQCKKLFIIVPYKEVLRSQEHGEHVNTYDEASFSALKCVRTVVFESYGLGKKSWWGVFFHVWFKNIFRFILKGETWVYTPPKEILFEIQGGL